MATLTSLITQVRSNVDEAAARYWSDAEITQWLNDGVKDIGRRTEAIQSFSTSISVVAGTATYNLPADLIRLHRIEFDPTGSTQIYPVKITTFEEIDSVWGINQASQASYPSYAVIWGYPGGAATLTIQLFPVPSQPGNLKLYYYRVPVLMVNGSDTPEIPGGWDDILVHYAEYRAKRKAKDPTWQEAKQLYEEEVVRLIDVTTYYHDNANTITVGSSFVPSWLYSFGD